MPFDDSLSSQNFVHGERGKGSSVTSIRQDSVIVYNLALGLSNRKMHFLCLHGAGTNSQVLEIQTAALRHELGGDHTYDFVEGVIPHPMSEAIETISASDDEYFVYYHPHDSLSFRKAVEDLGRYVAADGPFDGVIAFSQGTSLAAALVLEHQLRPACGNLLFKCAIFLSGRMPYIDAGHEPGIPDCVGGTASEATMEIPTTHIFGCNDEVEPGQGLALSRICNPQNRYVFEHDGGHIVPGPRDKDALIDSANTIKRMLAGV